ncbi:MAG TPA: phosphoribosyltransferase family protein [Nitrososphaeraceae archaeon]|nr:phosphoribosyltransferase family protein [Nitrososphaeraceae archaeon]
MQSIIFQDRLDASKRLAKKLLWLKQNQLKEERDRRQQSIVILAIPRGGVIIGDVIATELDAKLDIIVSRKIGAPDNPELAIGAVMPDGSYFLNQRLVNMLNVPQEYIQIQAHEQIKEIDRRLMAYRGSKEYDNEFERKAVVLVDDGIATGATMTASAKWIKNKQQCKRLVIAVPVAPAEVLDDLNQVADEVIVLYTPEPFIAIVRFYEDFAQVSDNEVKEIMRKYGYKV